MASILSDIGTSIGSELKSLDTRLSTAETTIANLSGQFPPPTGDFTIEPVTWTNLSEINLSGEKLVNGDFDLATLGLGVEVVVLTSWSNGGKTAQVGEVYEIDLVQSNGGMRLTNSSQSLFASATQMQNNVQPNTPENWSVHGAVPLNQDKLSQGIIKGDGGAVSIQQMFSNPIATGTKLVAKVTRADANEDGNVRLSTLRSNGTPFGNYKYITFADGFVEFETTETTHGIRLSTVHGTREVSSISLFQGVVNGGSVQANGNGGLERISGVGGWNAGASSTNFIEGNSNGYVQFQWGSQNKSLQIGLTYLDEDYENVEPFRMTINGNGHVFTNGSDAFSGGEGWATQGDFFRIRHYSQSNEIHFQKRQTVYSQNADFVIETASGSNYNYPSANRPLVIALDGTGNLTIGQLYRIHSVRATDQAVYLRDLDGNAKGWHGTATRNNRWQVVEELGEDYVTFHTHSSLANGNNLYVDSSLYHVGSLLNDVFLAK